MKAKLTSEQEQIQETIEEFLESRGGTELARRRMDGDEDVIDDLWDELARMDVPALTVPERYGGLGEGMVYLSAVLEATGQYAMPGPLAETAAFAVPLVDELADDEQAEDLLAPVASGDRRLSFALYDDRTESLPESIRLGGEVRDDGSIRLSGTKTLVPYGGEVDAVLVAVRTREAAGYDGLTVCVVDPSDAEVTASELRSLDRVRPMYDLAFDDVVVDEERVLGPVHGAGSAIQQAIDRFSVAACATLVGGAARAVDLSAAYGNERKQYGQPIGRFQAVKHRTADMWIDTQSARSLTYYAAWALDTNAHDATRAVSSAASYTGDRLHRVFGDGIWNHGGTGFTWDHDGHIYLKQAKAWRNFLGSPEEHRERLVEARLS